MSEEKNSDVKTRPHFFHVTRAARLLLIVLGWLMLSFTVHAASFDCGKATTTVEKLICADAELSKLDEELAAAYKTALQGEKHTESIRQTQKQWMKERNSCADAVCVKRTYETRLQGLASPTDTHTPLLVKVAASNAAPLSTPDKPGLFKLDQSTNSKVCVPLGRIINDDIKKYGKTRFDQHGEFAKWHKVEEENIDRGEPHKYDESVERADVDINNDGIVDQVIRTKWSIGRALNDALDIFPLNERKIVISELQQSKKSIMFNPGNYWLERYKKKYDDLNFDWVLDGVASINLLQLNNQTYVVAQNYAAPLNVSAKIYVFQLNKEYKKYEEKDVCMLVKICPCGGCEDLRGDEISKTLPAHKWCVK